MIKHLQRQKLEYRQLFTVLRHSASCSDNVRSCHDRLVLVLSEVCV